MLVFEGQKLEDNSLDKAFREAYQGLGNNNIFESIMLVDDHANGNPDTMGIISVRFFVENGVKAKADQKYALCLRSLGFGDVVIFDIISLDRPFHRDIIAEHDKRMGLRYPGLKNTDAYDLPIFVIGAHLRVDTNNKLEAFGESGDFGGNLVGADVNEVLKQLAFLAGIGNEESQLGKKFLNDLLDFLGQHKLQADFYERFVEKYIASKLTGQNFAGLRNMKVLDRHITEGEANLLKISVEEMSGGFFRTCMLLGIAEKIKAKS